MRNVRWLGAVIASSLIFGVALTTPAEARDSQGTHRGGTSVAASQQRAAAALAGCSSNPIPEGFFGLNSFFGSDACAQCLAHYDQYWSGGYYGFCKQWSDVNVGLYLASRPPVPIYSIPGTSGRETGEAATSDSLVPFCTSYDNNGLLWVLVVIRNGRGTQPEKTAGWIRFNDRAWNKTLFSCFPNQWTTITNSGGIFQVDMYAIPGNSGRWLGVARSGQDLWAMCTETDNHGLRWDLVINRNGIDQVQFQDTTGFVPYQYTVGVYDLPKCV